MTATITDSRLEEMMADEAGCEAKHGYASCSIAVTHRYRVPCVHLDRLVCANVASEALAQMARGATCRDCKAPTSDCWSVVPV